MFKSHFDIRSQPGFGLITLFTFFALYLPIAALVIYSFNGAESLSRWDGFSARWFVAAWQNAAVQDAAIRSLIIAVWARSPCHDRRHHGGSRDDAHDALSRPHLQVCAHQPAADGTGNRDGRGAAHRLLAHQGLDRLFGLGYLIVAHTAFCIPFAYLPIRARLESMDLTLERRGRPLCLALADLPACDPAAAAPGGHRWLHVVLRHLPG
jgi:spermidine/putrescine transport system permease protein